MEFIGKCSGITHDMLSGKCIISFEADASEQQVMMEYQKMAELDKLRITAKRYTKKRSLTANAYAWVLMTKMATVLRTSKEEVYELMLKRYGQLYEDDGGNITITVSNKVDISKIDGHWLRIKSNSQFTAYAMIKGSSEYDTAEMACFIDGLISECRELDIETLPPEEIERMKQEWQVDIRTAS